MTNSNTTAQLQTIVEQFIPNVGVIAIAPVTTGHINDSYVVTTAGERYFLQRINHTIFKDVATLQNNIVRVTQHLRKKLAERGTPDIGRRVLTILPTHDGQWFYKDRHGNYWRMMAFISDSYSYDTITPDLACKAGRAFGEFQAMLADLPGEPLAEVIPDFHNMEIRLGTFREAVSENRANRLNEVRALVGEIEKRADEMCRAEQLHREGLLPKRINHCDTKVNNILFDSASNALCIVDLDTVMPGFVLSDFGDFIRTGANTGTEDDTNLDNVSINLSIFEAYTKGYLEAAKDFLTPIEIDNLAFGTKLLTYMQTVRFLTDYIDGDRYYKIKSAKHNLERSLAQFKLLQSMEANFEQMQQILKKYC